MTKTLAAFLLLGVLAGCSFQPPRTAPPASMLSRVVPSGFVTSFRFIESNAVAAASSQPYPFQSDLDGSMLAISGGGQKGAFGAGFLSGWTARGDRPEFSVVTGVSTGSILAVFAFLGPDKDETLKAIYTTYDTRQILKRDVVGAVFGGPSVYKATGYEALIARYIDEAIVQQIATEAARGRKLIIGTTNLDALTQVHWDITAIAASGDPQALPLIRQIMQASSAIPGLFPPVEITVRGPSGKMFREMHVDGGATEQITIVSPHLAGATDITLLVNERASPIYHPVRNRALDITQASVASLLNATLDADVREILAAGQQARIPVRIVTIPNSFNAVPSQLFDPVYMRALYQRGQLVARTRVR